MDFHWLNFLLKDSFRRRIVSRKHLDVVFSWKGETPLIRVQLVKQEAFRRKLGPTIGLVVYFKGESWKG